MKKFFEGDKMANYWKTQIIICATSPVLVIDKQYCTVATKHHPYYM